MSDTASKRRLALNLSQKGLLVVFIPVAFQVILLVSLFAIERAHDRDRAADRQSKEVIGSGYRLLGLLVDAETGMRGYALTGNPAFSQPYDRAILEFPVELQHLRALAVLTPENSDNVHIAELETLARPVLAFQHTSIGQVRAGHRDEVIASISQPVGQHLMDRFRDGLAPILVHEALTGAPRV